MKGWVYIISNKAMPDLVKVGFSTKDPIDRANELGTGSPLPYHVEYEICVENPKQIEKRAHDILSFVNEGKEWFRCNIETAIRAIRKSCSDEDIIVERILNAEEKLKFQNNQSSTLNSNNRKQNNLIGTQLSIPLSKITKKPVLEIHNSIVITQKNMNFSESSINDLAILAKTEPNAAYELGQRYDVGNGVRKSLKDAFKYFLSAAENGHELAALFVGKGYLTGRGAEKDLYSALVFLKKSADKDNTEAQYLFGKNIDFIDMSDDKKIIDLKNNWCPDQKSEEYALSYIYKAVVKNYAPAQLHLGIHFYLQGNHSYAFELYERAAKNGYPLAQRYLADCYLDGTGCKINKTLAKEWYQKAAEGKDSIAKKKLENWDWHSQF